ISSRAQLGAKTVELLAKGKSISDELIIELVVEALNKIPQGHGWIMDDFPKTVNQAKLLHEALTGKDPEKVGKKPKKTLLVTDPMDSLYPPVLLPGLDFAVLLDISDNEVLKRATNIQFNPDTTQLSDKEKRENKNDPVTHQIEHRITGFLDSWPKLEKWFSEQQNILIKTDGEVEENLMCKKMEEVFLTEAVKKQKEFPQIFNILNENREIIPELPSRGGTVKRPESSPPRDSVADETDSIKRSETPTRRASTSAQRASMSPRRASISARRASISPRRASISAQRDSLKRSQTPTRRDSIKPGEALQPTEALLPSTFEKPIAVLPGSIEWPYVNEPLAK
ncbi:sperm flagellar protein 2-like, partial [Rhinatrema bivittatum]|uniref:sperm flagellar protein 2-like n=1 Tax=Rhinatrema bivittatum TaxID=194408 RepID=UPI001127849E